MNQRPVEERKDNTKGQTGRNPVNMPVVLGIVITVLLSLHFVLLAMGHQGLFGFLKDLFMLKYLPKLTGDVSLGLLFIFGVLTSFHCVGMCGGIAISQTVGKKEQGQKPSAADVLIPSALYNIGRITAYTLAGGIVGGLGQIVTLTGIWSGIVPIVGGIFMIVMAINLLGIIPALRRLQVGLPKALSRKILAETHRKEGSMHYGPLGVGFLTGLMPCGPMQMAQLYALSTGSIVHGALSMFIFSLGTVPLLFIFGLLNTVINKKHSTVILRFSAVLVFVLGTIMVGRGLALTGFDLHIPHMVLREEHTAEKNSASVQGEVQLVETELKTGAFPDITVQKGLRVKWNLHAQKDQLNDCNNAIAIRKLHIERNLLEGDNIIEFTPTETGIIPYTCWMGMITAKITVVEQLDGQIAEEEPLQQASVLPAAGKASNTTGESGQPKTEPEAAPGTFTPTEK